METETDRHTAVPCLCIAISKDLCSTKIIHSKIWSTNRLKYHYDSVTKLQSTCSVKSQRFKIKEILYGWPKEHVFTFSMVLNWFPIMLPLPLVRMLLFCLYLKLSPPVGHGYGVFSLGVHIVLRCPHGSYKYDNFDNIQMKIWHENN